MTAMSGMHAFPGADIPVVHAMAASRRRDQSSIGTLPLTA